MLPACDDAPSTTAPFIVSDGMSQEGVVYPLKDRRCFVTVHHTVLGVSVCVHRSFCKKEMEFEILCVESSERLQAGDVSAKV